MKKYKKYLEESVGKIVDIHTYNLSKLYSDFNRKYFDNKLPMIPIRIGVLKSSGGYFQFSYNRKTGEVFPKEIVISKFIETTEERLFGILIHEMIHVWIAIIEGRPKEHHGFYFMDKLLELNKKTPFVIPKTDNTEGLEINVNVKDKTLYVIIVTYINKVKGYRYGILQFNKPIQKTDLDRFKQNFIWPKDQKIQYYSTNEKQLQRYPIKRKVTRGFKFSLIPDILGDLVLKNGKYIDTIHPSEDR